MATRTGQGANENKGQYVYTWTGLLNGDDGVWIEIPDKSDMTISVLGTFGVGGTLLFEGSNDKTNEVVLSDPQGAALSFTAVGVRVIQENPRFIRPRVSAGDGTTDLTLIINAVGPK